jgi:gliding motility-associated-like protein
MKTLFLKLLVLLPIFVVGITFGQNVTMSNGSSTQCSGTFYDPGGTGNYGNSQTFTYTFCPSTPGADMMFNFTSFSLENAWDFLYIYDGNSIAAPSLGTYTGTTGPGTVTASPTNLTGCITFRFTSDGSGVAAGWAATISCSTPCPTITTSIASTTPAAVAGIVKRCPGQSVSFSATAGSGGTGPYTYSWNYGDGATGTGQNVSHAYATAGSYQASLTATDANGCPTTTSSTVIVQVATTPTITTAVAPNPICLGQSANLTANVTMTPYVPNCTPPVSGTTFLPDGSGVSYSTGITVNCFNAGQTVTAASNISNICLTLEHSYLGDLQIVLICPNGQQMILKSYASGGNGTYLGNPIDNTTGGPGTGSLYCFTPAASTLLVNGGTVSSGSPAGNSIAAGNYMPVDPFTNLVGCPLNGTWTIQVTDNLSADDGYIFNWDVNFTTPPATGSFTPTIASQGWNAATGLTSTGLTTATITPTAAGAPCYTYTVVDNFGCTWTQNQCITVNANVPVNAGPDVSGCPGSTLTIGGAPSGPVGMTYSWVETGANANIAITSSTTIANPTVTISAGATGTATYTVTGTSAGCVTTDVVVVTVVPPPVVNAGADQTVCAGGSATLTASGATTYTWSPATGLSATTGATVTSTPAATITYTVTGTTGGCTATDQVVLTVNPVATANANVDQTVCVGGSITLAGTVGGSATTGTWSAPTGTFSNASSLTSTYTPTITSGTVTLTLTSNDPAGPCPAVTDIMVVTVNPVATANANVDQAVCAGGTVTLAGAVGGSATSGTWSAPTGTFSNASSLTSTYTPSITSGTVTLTLTTNDPAGPCLAVTDQMIITVNPLPTVSAGPDVAICTGAATTLTATGAATYTWSPATALSGTTTASVTANPTATTTYTVTGTSAAGCINTDQVVVTVNPLPTVNAGADQTICVGASVTLAGSGAATYTWNNGVTNGVAFAPAATTTYTVTGTSAAGCVNTDQVVVTVNPLPVVVANDVTVCLGGSVPLNASGASTYTWSPGTNLSATTGASVVSTPTATITYTVSGTSAAGCVSTDPITVTVSGSASINAGPDVAICAGASTTLTATGGATYTWNNGLGAGNGFSVSPAATTTYTVVGTDVSGCTGTDAVTVTVNPLPTVNAGLDQTICVGATVTLSGSGAATYTWNNGVTNGVAFAPAATTTYTVTGTTAAGCINTDQVVVTVNPLPTVNAGVDQTICVGASVTLNGSGASTYTWNNGVTNGVAFAPAATTTYTVTGTSAAGCISTDQVVVTVNPLPTVNAGVDQTICVGASVTLSGSGAATYTWNNGVTNGVAFAPTATTTTTYTVTGTDVNGCINTDQVVVTVNPLPTVNAGPDVAVCIGGSVTLTGSGAATYSWSGGITNGVAFAPSATATYTLTGTSAAGCINTDQVVVTVNPLPLVNAGPDISVCTSTPVTLNGSGASIYVWSGGITNGVAFTPATTTYTLTGTDVNGCVNTDAVTVTVLSTAPINAGPDVAICTGASTTLTATGGVTYNWNNGLGIGNGFSVSPAATSTYTVVGTDAAGCVGTDAVTVTVNPLPVVNAGLDQTVCAGTSVTLTATGAATYSWTGGVTNGIAFVPAATTTYTVTGTTAAGCTATDVVTVTVNPLPIVDAGVDQAVCAGTSVTLNGAGAATYTWTGGVTNGVAFVPAATVTYTVTGTTAAGCTATDVVTVTVNPLPVVNAGPDQTICVGVTPVTLTATGAATYTWDNGVTNGVAFAPAATATYTVTGTSAAGCISTDQVVVTVNPLPVVNAGVDQTICIGASITLSGSGAATYTWDNGVTNGATFAPTATTTYTVTGTSVAGCINTDQVVVTVNPLPVVNAGPDQTICVGASVTLTGSGAAIYTWTGGVSNGVAFAPAATTTYTVTGTSAAGCISTDAVTVTVNPLPMVNAGPDQTVCDGTGITLTASGASTYSWDNGVTNGVGFTPAVGTITYTVTGTSAAGCIASDQVIVTVNPNPVPTINGPTQYCATFSATLGTNIPYTTYLWSTGATTSTINATIANNPITVTVTNGFGCSATTPVFTVTENAQITANFTVTVCQGQSATIHGIPQTLAGVYSQTFTTASGCDSVANVTLVVNPLPAINAGLDQAVCTGIATVLTATGGLNYAWDNAVTNGIPFTQAIGTTTYTVTGTDINGCVNTDQVNITVNPLPLINAGPDQAICIGATATLNGSGGSTYTWNNGVTNGVAFTPAATNTYTVTGTDVNGCINTDQVLVTVNPLPAVNAGLDQTICIGASVTLTGSGASTYTWNNGVTNAVAFAPAATNTYTVTGTDVNGCINTDQVLVTVNPLPVVNAGPDVAICIGASATLAGSGASSYTWNNGVSNNVVFSPAATATYTVTGTDVNGCINTDQVLVTVNALPVVIAGIDQALCIGASATLSGAGATTYSWNNGVTNGVAFAPSNTNTYTVTGTDANGCINTDQVVVTVNSLPAVNAGADQVTCIGGTVTLSGSGAATYTWNNGVTNGVSFAPAATTTYTVTGTDVNGCINTDQVLVTVNALPTVNAGPDQTVCIGTAVTLTGTGAATYSWDNGITQGVAFTPAVGTLTYTVSGTSGPGCIATDQVNVTVNALPIVNAGPDQALCIGATATLSGSGAATYTWNNGVTNATAFAPALTNTYTVTGTDVNGCINTDQATVTVNPLPAVNAGVDQTICIGASVTLTGSGASIYSWNNGVSNGVSFAPAATTTYTVTGTDVNGCINTDQVLVTVNTLPIVNAGPDQTVCVGTAVTLTGTGASTYSWDNGVNNGVAFTPGVGTITYTVTGTSGASCIATDQVVVTVNALPVVNAGVDQALCIGASATLSGAGATTYTWNNGITNGTAFTPAATNTYTVTGTDGNGCINTDQVVVTVNPLPSVDAGLDQVICIGNSVTLFGTLPLSVGASVVSWDNGITNGVAFAPVATTTYTVTGTDANGCLNTDQVIVTVNALPVVNAGPDQTVCIGTQVTLNGSGANTYTWDNGITNGVAFTPAVGTTVYTVTGTNGNNCTNTDQVSVIVNPLPVVNAGADVAVCAGTSVTLTGSGAATYSWDNGITNGNAFVPSTTTTYTLTGTSAAGCVSTDQVTVTVNPIPNVFAGNDITLCENQTLTLTGSGAATYTWNNGVIDGGQFTPAIGTTTYTVTGTTVAGCINTDQVDVLVNPLPIVSFMPDTTQGCTPVVVTFTNTTPNASNCVWTLGNGDVINGCGTVQSTFTQPGCFDVTLTTTSTDGCTNSMTSTNLICVEAYPIASFSTSGNELTTIQTEVHFTNNSIGAVAYEWNFGDGSASTSTVDPTHTYPEIAENYIVELVATSPLGCSDTAYATIQVEEALLFYVPNTYTPDDDNYNEIFKPVFTSGFDPYDYTLLIFNRWGEIIFESHDSNVGWNGTYGSNGEILMVQDGTYTWKIEFKTLATDERKMVVGHVNVIR